MDERSEPAGIVSRFAAFVVDLAVIGAGASASAWIVTAAGSLFLPAASWTREVTSVLGGASYATVAVAYFVGLWAVAGRTAGQLLLGLRVVSEPDGGRVTLTRALLRFAGCVLAALPLYLGFLWIAVDPQRRGWHDRLAGTRVVYDPPREALGRRALRAHRDVPVSR